MRVQLYIPGGFNGQRYEDHKFGEVLYGVQDMAQKVADIASENFSLFSSGKADRENIKVPVLLSGKGTGKSSFLHQHVEQLRKYTKDAQLLSLLTCPLILNISFDSRMYFDPFKERDISTDALLAPRVICSYLHECVDWLYIKTLDCSKTDLGEVLELILDHHRRVNNLNDDHKVAIVLNVDELNQLHGNVAKIEDVPHIRDSGSLIRDKKLKCGS